MHGRDLKKIFGDKMTIRKLASVIAKREGKKSQARIGDIREILSILSDMWYEEVTKNEWRIDESAKECIDVVLYLNGKKRSKV